MTRTVPTPAIRVKALLDAFGDGELLTSVCDSDYGPALKQLGQRINLSLGLAPQCVPAPLLTASGSLVCRSGDVLGFDADNKPVLCTGDCLEQADCVVTSLPAAGDAGPAPTPVERCPSELFGNPGDTSCGERCPCWRVIPHPSCEPGLHHAVEILAAEESRTAIEVTCRLDGAYWPAQRADRP